MSKIKQDTFITNSSKETQILAESFVKRLKAGDVLALYGNLGSGKTTFVQGLAKGLGIKKRIISPTFVFVRQYKVSPPRSPSPLRQGFAGRVGHLGGGKGIRLRLLRGVTLFTMSISIELKINEKLKDWGLKK